MHQRVGVRLKECLGGESPAPFLRGSPCSAWILVSRMPQEGDRLFRMKPSTFGKPSRKVLGHTGRNLTCFCNSEMNGVRIRLPS